MASVINEDLATLDLPPFLKQCVGKGKEIPPGSLLQVQQVTNVSFPTSDKSNYNADHHTLKLTVTDGHSQGYALVPDGCPGINANTSPGTKIKTTQSIPVQGSLFVITRNNCEVLGGKVAKLFEKWEIQKKMEIKHEWGYTGSAVEGEGPPPWKPFGYKPTMDVSALRKMKTTDVASEKKDAQSGGAKSQFDMQRDEAISELQAVANKQKFQKPNKHLLDKEITDIMDEGFSQSEAEYAMNRFKNTQKALKFLKDSKKRQDGVPREPPKPIADRKDFRRKKGKGLHDEDEEQEVPREYKAPAATTSLFAFIEGQIKSDDKPVVQKSNGPSSDNYSGGGGRTRDLEDGFGRLNIKDSRDDRGYHGRNDRGRGRGGSYRGGGRGDSNRNDHRGGGGNSRDSYQSQQQRGVEGRGTKPVESTQRPPRFQNRSAGGGNDTRYSDYNQSGSGSARNEQPSGGNYDGYRGSNRDNYDRQPHSSSYTSSSNSSHQPSSSNRHDYGSGYQTHPQQRSSGGKDRSSTYSSDSYSHQQQYPKSNEYSVPSQQQSYHNSYPPPQQHQTSGGTRQYANNNSHNNYEHIGHPRSAGGGSQSRPQHYSNHSGGGGGTQGNPPPQSEFGHYQYGYDGWNPSQSLVFTRSKGESRGGRGGGGGGYTGGGVRGGGTSQPTSYNNRSSNNRY